MWKIFSVRFFSQGNFYDRQVVLVMLWGYKKYWVLFKPLLEKGVAFIYYHPY